ncbi:MAG TPA: type II toxin-antitoxin system VapC family toxin [Caulobacteraceae bacterium]|nr:type II toxin-antitoxin system VapC family toxin [Caulobacteraceae bacterium]
MRVLLDTHVALWAVTGDQRLSRTARSSIDGNDQVHVSVVSLWEIAIKFALRKGRPNDMPVSPQRALELFTSSQFVILPLFERHVLAVAGLPPARSDPFDRMLIAQARSEPLQLLTSDTAVAAYGEGIELV